MTRQERLVRYWKVLRRWAARLVAFYFGYKILHREIYGSGDADPLVIALGLWLCGIAPADIFDGLRKVGDKVTGSTTSASTPQPQSGSSGNGDPK